MGKSNVENKAGATRIVGGVMLGAGDWREGGEVDPVADPNAELNALMAGALTKPTSDEGSLFAKFLKYFNLVGGVGSKTNSVTGRNVISGGIIPAIGRDYTTVLLPLNQSGGPSVLPTDYSGLSVPVTFGTVTTPWANTGYFTSVGGSGKQEFVSVPVSAVGLNISTDSFIVGMTINKATPAGTETIAGCSNTSSTPGIYLNINSTGKLGPRLFVNGAAASVTYGTITAADATDHRIIFSWDAVAKTVTTYVDGVKDITQTAATVLATDIIATSMRLGMCNTGDTVDCKFAGFEWLTFKSSGLPVNMAELALNDNAHRRSGMVGAPVFL